MSNPIFIQTEHHVIDAAKITAIVIGEKRLTLRFVGGKDLVLPLAKGEQLMEAMRILDGERKLTAWHHSRSGGWGAGHAVMMQNGRGA